MKRLNLKDLLNRAETILKEKKYSESTIQDYKYVWKKFYDICELCNIKYFDLELAKKFLEKYYHIDTKNGKGRMYTRRMRSIYVLDSINRNKQVKIYRPKIEKKLPKEFNNIFYEYDNYLKSRYSYSTIRRSEKILVDFFNYLKQNNITSIKNIQIQNIYNFVNAVNHQQYSKNTIYEIKYKLKIFFQYLYDNNKYKFSGIDIFPKIAKVERSKLPSYYTIDEINQILKQVNRNTKKGKRDFAILLLAIVYGLRNSDIVHLKKENIMWNENKIELIQYKTKKLLELPLTENVKYALLDYIKNARPNIDSPHIFLPTKAPYTYTDMKNYSSLYKSVEQYIKKANIDIGNRKRGLHSLRHSLASNMLKNNIKISTISEILGHSSVNITNIYLSIDEKQLRKLALEVPKYE